MMTGPVRSGRLTKSTRLYEQYSIVLFNRQASVIENINDYFGGKNQNNQPWVGILKLNIFFFNERDIFSSFILKISSFTQACKSEPNS